MEYGRLSLSIGIGLDGSWIDWQGSPSKPAWPCPPELHMVKRGFRHLTVLDPATFEALNVANEEKREPGMLGRHIVLAAEEQPSSAGSIHEPDLAHLFLTYATAFVHVAGGSRLTAAALRTGLVDEVDVTLYPAVGGELSVLASLPARFNRLSAKTFDDGRITSKWSVQKGHQT